MSFLKRLFGLTEAVKPSTSTHSNTANGAVTKAEQPPPIRPDTKTRPQSACTPSAAVPSTASATPGKDFADVYPELCVICTSLPQSDFPSGDSAQWATVNCGVTVGSHLDFSTRREVDELLARYRAKNDFRVSVLCGLSISPLSDDVVELAKAHLDVLKRDRNQYREVSMMTEDVLGKAGLIRLCWFFRK